MLRRNVDLIAVSFLLIFVLATAAGRSLVHHNHGLFDIDSAHLREIRPQVMEIRKEVLEARKEVRDGAYEVRQEMLRARDELRNELRRIFRNGRLKPAQGGAAY